MAEQIPEGHRRNALGHLVPESLIKPIDKLRDSFVREWCAKAKQNSRQASRPATRSP